MSKTVLLLGRLGVVVEDARRQLGMPEVRLLTATDLEEVRAAMEETGNRIDHVIMGAGLELEDRLAIIREIMQTSDTTTVHMKDFASGPAAFLPFVQSVLTGLAGYEP